MLAGKSELDQVQKMHDLHSAVITIPEEWQHVNTSIKTLLLRLKFWNVPGLRPKSVAMSANQTDAVRHLIGLFTYVWSATKDQQTKLAALFTYTGEPIAQKKALSHVVRV